MNVPADGGFKWYMDSLWPELPEEERNLYKIISELKNFRRSLVDNFVFNLSEIRIYWEVVIYTLMCHLNISIIIVITGMNIDYMKTVDWLISHL